MRSSNRRVFLAAVLAGGFVLVTLAGCGRDATLSRAIVGTWTLARQNGHAASGTRSFSADGHCTTTGPDGPPWSGTWAIKDGMLTTSDASGPTGLYKVEIEGGTMTFKGPSPEQDTVFARK
jgi:hypothetical protein